MTTNQQLQGHRRVTVPAFPPLPDDWTFLAVTVAVPRAAAEAHRAEMETVARDAIAHALGAYLETADD